MYSGGSHGFSTHTPSVWGVVCLVAQFTSRNVNYKFFNHLGSRLSFTLPFHKYMSNHCWTWFTRIKFATLLLSSSLFCFVELGGIWSYRTCCFWNQKPLGNELKLIHCNVLENRRAEKAAANQYAFTMPFPRFWWQCISQHFDYETFSRRNTAFRTTQVIIWFGQDFLKHSVGLGCLRHQKETRNCSDLVTQPSKSEFLPQMVPKSQFKIAKCS